MPRIPPHTFGAAFGLAGLAGTWSAAAGSGLAPAWVGQAIAAVAAATWLVVLGAYLSTATRPGGHLLSDLVHPVIGPFLSLALITPMLLAAAGLAPHAPAVGAVLTDVFLVLTLVHGLWFSGMLIHRRCGLHKLHPGHFLPPVAGGLVASLSSALVGQPTLGYVMFAYGTASWLVLGSIILPRLFIRSAPPVALGATLAIEVAPAAAASLAWFALDGGEIDTVAKVLAVVGMLMVLAHGRLLPIFRTLSFSVGFWAFTFSWAAIATVTVHWLVETHPPGYVVWARVAVALVTVGIGAIAVRSMAALAAGTLFPPAPAPAPVLTPAPVVPPADGS